MTGSKRVGCWTGKTARLGAFKNAPDVNANLARLFVCASVTLLPWQRSGYPEGMPLAFWSLKHPTKLIAFFVNRSDDQPHRYPNIDERCL